MATTLERPAGTKKWLGTSYPRKEDERQVQGQGNFVDDMRLPGMAHAAIVRSPFAHARILSIDASEALKLPGVVAVVTGEQIARETQPVTNLLAPPYDKIEDVGIAIGKVRYVGEPVAVIVAEDKYIANDALELVDVQYQRLDPVVNVDQGIDAKSPRIHENVPSNVMWQKTFTYGDPDAALREADLVIKDKFHFHRFTSAPLEPNAMVAQYSAAKGTFTVWSNNQRPAFNLHFIAHALKTEQNRFRFITPDIGGGFGIKNDSYPYIIIMCVVARAVNRPVKWIETRREHLQASTHGSEFFYEVEMGFRKDGTITGYKAKSTADEGAYMRREPIGAINFVRHATMAYNFKHLQMDIVCVATNKCPVGPNRSYGKMQQCYLLERCIERAAEELGIDQAEIRKRNFVERSQMPYEAPSGMILDDGDYKAALDKVLANVDYPALRREQEAARKQGKMIGIGIAMGMDACPVNFSINRLISPNAKASGDSEAAWVKLDEQGNVVVAVGTSPQGHGHETVGSQIAADELGVHPDRVHVVSGFDTYVNPATPHSGTYASRFAMTGALAIRGAAQKVATKVLRLGAHLLGEPADDLELVDTSVRSRRTGKSVPLAEIGRLAWRDVANLPAGEEAGLQEFYVHRVPFGLPKDAQRGNFSLTYSYAASVAVVEVDLETGFPTLRSIAIVEDCGNKLNPQIVEGQIHGQLGHQLGGALYEELTYDEDGQLLAATFKDYLAPTSADLPSYNVDSITTPSLFTPLGARGMGEGGGSPLIACVNAVEDALRPLGIHLHDSYLNPEAIRGLIREKQAR